MLERGRGRQIKRKPQLPYQLVTVKRVKKVYIARPPVKHFNGKFAMLHIDARRRLIGIAAVFQFNSLHRLLLSFIVLAISLTCLLSWFPRVRSLDL